MTYKHISTYTKASHCLITHTDTYTHMCMHTHTHTHSEKEKTRERERKRKRFIPVSGHSWDYKISIVYIPVARD